MQAVRQPVHMFQLRLSDVRLAQGRGAQLKVGHMAPVTETRVFTLMRKAYRNCDRNTATQSGTLRDGGSASTSRLKSRLDNRLS